MHDAQSINLGGFLSRTARLFPERKAVIEEGRSWSWKDVDLRVQAMATALKDLGLEKGDRINLIFLTQMIFQQRFIGGLISLNITNANQMF